MTVVNYFVSEVFLNDTTLYQNSFKNSSKLLKLLSLFFLMAIKSTFTCHLAATYNTCIHIYTVELWKKPIQFDKVSF